MRSWLALVSLAAVLVACAARPAGAESPSGDEEASKIHYEAGARFYESGRYRDALQAFDEAYQKSHRAALRHNMALCHERLGEVAAAIRAYEDYLASTTDLEQRAEILSRVRMLRAREPAASLAARPVTARRGMRKYPFALAGTSLALFLSSIGTGVAAQEREDRLSARCPAALCPANDAIAAATQTEGKRLAIATDTLIGLGTAAGIASIITIVIEARRPQGER